ncbi:uncharacterized protein LOC144755652 isoform X2 [Lissotriton helveticus]
MFKQIPNKVPVTLSDAATYFPEEEWKLLHEWQKELYRNVMNEIHQALISLGPLIATTVFSLRDNERESARPVVSQDSEAIQDDKHPSGGVAVDPEECLEVKMETNQCLKNRKNSNKRRSCDYPSIGQAVLCSDTSVKITKSKGTPVWEPVGSERTSINPSTSDIYSPVHPDILLQIEEQKELLCRDWSDLDRTKVNNPPNKGIPSLNSDNCLRKDDEPNAFQINHLGDERGKHRTTPSSGIPSLNSDNCLRKDDEPNAFQINHLGDERGKHRTTPSSGLEFTSLIIKEEDEICSLDHQEIRSRRSINLSTPQEESMNRKRKDSACTERLPVNNVSSWQNDINLPQTTGEETEPQNQLWSENYWGLGVERNSDCEMGFSNPTHINLQLWTPKEGTSDTSNMHFSGLKKASLFQTTKQIQRLYSCTECKRSFSLRGELIRHFRTHSGVRPYACTQCNKSFSKKGDFTRHWRTHTGEKPYECTDCHKRFNLKGNLDQHRILIHSGVRPYKCDECEKCFSRQSHLTKHRETHAITFLSSHELEGR